MTTTTTARTIETDRKLVAFNRTGADQQAYNFLVQNAAADRAATGTEQLARTIEGRRAYDRMVDHLRRLPDDDLLGAHQDEGRNSTDADRVRARAAGRQVGIRIACREWTLGS